VSDFKKLSVWRKAHALMLNVHRTAVAVRGPEYTTLRSQMLRAAMSVSANIVEGSGQESRAQFRRFLLFSLNSANELEYHLVASFDLNLISMAEFKSLSDQNTEVRKMLHGLIKRVSADLITT
jgi:four helix bundle protein